MLLLLPPAVVAGKELGLPEIVGVFVVEGNWTSDKVCAVVVKKENVAKVVTTVAIEEDGVLEIVHGVVFEEYTY